MAETHNTIRLTINTDLPKSWTRDLLKHQLSDDENEKSLYDNVFGDEIRADRIKKGRQRKDKKLNIPVNLGAEREISEDSADAYVLKAELKVKATGIRSSDIIIELENINPQSFHDPVALNVMRIFLWRIYGTLTNNLAK